VFVVGSWQEGRLHWQGIADAVIHQGIVLACLMGPGSRAFTPAQVSGPGIPPPAPDTALQASLHLLGAKRFLNISSR